MTQAAFARYLGVSDERVRQYRQAGILSMTDDGRIDFVEALHDLEAHGDSTKGNTKRKIYKNGEGRKPAHDLDPDEDLRTQHLRAKIEYQFERARLSRLKADEQEGKLVHIDEVRADAFEAAHMVRNQILAIPDRVSAEIAGMADAGGIHQLLTDELRQALSELAEAVQE